MEGYIVVAFLGMEKQATAKQLREQELECPTLGAPARKVMVARDIVLQIILAPAPMEEVVPVFALPLPSPTADRMLPALVRNGFPRYARE